MPTPVHSSCFFLSTACDCIRSLLTGLRIARDAQQAADLERNSACRQASQVSKVCAVVQPGAIWCNPDCAGAQNEQTVKLTCDIAILLLQNIHLSYIYLKKHRDVRCIIVSIVSFMNICHSSTFHRCS